jgi:hypothetical protein
LFLLLTHLNDIKLYFRSLGKRKLIKNKKCAKNLFLSISNAANLVQVSHFSPVYYCSLAYMVCVYLSTIHLFCIMDRVTFSQRVRTYASSYDGVINKEWIYCLTLNNYKTGQNIWINSSGRGSWVMLAVSLSLGSRFENSGRMRWIEFVGYSTKERRESVCSWDLQRIYLEYSPRCFSTHAYEVGKGAGRAIPRSHTNS